MTIYTNNTFYQQYGKRIFDLLVSFFVLFLLSPLFALIAVAIVSDSEGSILFKQKRIGKAGKIFVMYKFRTMLKNAEVLKKKYLKFNEASGPVFKIKDDPRFTSVGKYLARTGLDELPQLINVLAGNMSLIGPRPLPVDEARELDRKTRKLRESVLPGITSLWVISGAHELSFQNWMKLDREYILNMSFSLDLVILFLTIKMVVKSFISFF